MERHATRFEIHRGNNILYTGISRPNAGNMYFTSVHAEVLACQYIRKLGHTRKLKILIWRETSTGVMPSHCCINCTNYLIKYGLQDIVYTIEKCKYTKAVIANPKLSLGMFIKLQCCGATPPKAASGANKSVR